MEKKAKKKGKGGTINIVRVCVKVSDTFTQTRILPVRVSTGFHVEHRRPKAGDAPHEGALKVERRDFEVFRVKGLGLAILAQWGFCSNGTLLARVAEGVWRRT